MKQLVFLDTETTGLDPATHQVWEIAWAFENGDVRRLVVPHTLVGADPLALELNNYHSVQHTPAAGASWREDLLRETTLYGATIVGSNPSFDTAFLRARWGAEPWHHRKLDLAAYAMPYLGTLSGLADIATALGVKQPDHTAAQDVLTLRECFLRLRSIYGNTFNRKDTSA